MQDHHDHDFDQSPPPKPVIGNRPAANARHAMPSGAPRSGSGDPSAGDFLGLEDSLEEALRAMPLPENEEAFNETEEAQEPSWLFSFDGPDEAPVEEPSRVGPQMLDVAWSEGPPTAKRLLANAVRFGAAALAGMLAVAGYQFFTVRSELKRNGPATATPRIEAPISSEPKPEPPRERTPLIGKGDAEPETTAPTSEDDVAADASEPGWEPRPRKKGRDQTTEPEAGSAVTAVEPELVEPGDFVPPVPRVSRVVRDRWRSLFGMSSFSTGTLVRTLETGIAQNLVRPVVPDLRSQWIAVGENLTEFPTMRLATSEELAGIWPSYEIPIDRIDSPRRILTPVVGGVRIVFDTGEIFEGRLYAVGEGNAWIDFGPGRVGLDGRRIVTMEHLVADEGPFSSDLAAGQIVGLQYVRVRAKGGVFLAKLIYQDEENTLVLTEEGTRVTIPSADVEILGRQPSVLVKLD